MMNHEKLFPDCQLQLLSSDYIISYKLKLALNISSMVPLFHGFEQALAFVFNCKRPAAIPCPVVTSESDSTQV